MKAIQFASGGQAMAVGSVVDITPGSTGCATGTNTIGAKVDVSDLLTGQRVCWQHEPRWAPTQKQSEHINKQKARANRFVLWVEDGVRAQARAPAHHERI